MTPNEYQTQAMRWLNPALSERDTLINGVMGLCGESGEVIDILKKHEFQGHELNVPKLVDELGDVAWYLALACTALSITLDDVMQHNIDKLRSRYPEGFDSDRSIHREE